MRVFILTLLCLIISPLLTAAELHKVEVKHEDGHYRLYLHAVLTAPIQRVAEIITDYGRLDTINPYLKQSEVEQIDETQQTLVHLITESCVLFFCYEVLHDQLFEPMQNGVLKARIAGEKSDFKSGSFSWTIQAEGEMTSIIMQTDVEPAFMIPPMIGPYMLEKKLREIALATVINIERLAMQSLDENQTGLD